MILEASQLFKKYQSPNGKLEILKGVDIGLRENEINFILGRSGSGKSTLLHILGLLDIYDQGTLLFEGKDVSGLSENERSRLRNQKMGFIFQFYHLLPELTLLENVSLPGFIASKRDTREKARELLNQVGLSDREKHFPSQLSGGEQQRGAIVRALMNDPRIVFCDEPTGNLDEASSELVMNLIQKLNQERRQTFCIVTHDQNLTKLGHSVYQLRRGVLHALNS